MDAINALRAENAYFARRDSFDLGAINRIVADQVKNLVVRTAKAESDLATAQEQIVWGFHGEEVPQYTQGPKGEHEMREPITAEEANGLVKTIVNLRTELAVAKTNTKRLETALYCVEQNLITTIGQVGTTAIFSDEETMLIRTTIGNTKTST